MKGSEMIQKSAFKYWALVGSILAFVIGLLIAFTPLGVNIIFNYLFVAALGVIGISKICRYASFKEQRSAWDLVLGIIYLLLCMMLFSQGVEVIQATIGIVLGIVAVIGGISRFFMAYDVRQVSKKAPISWLIVSGIICVLLGICLICLPIATQVIYTYLIGIFLMAYGIVTFISALCIKTSNKKK